MKDGSDNFRESATLSLIKRLHDSKIKMVIFEPKIKDRFYDQIPVESNLNKFIEKTDLIITNRLHDDLKNCSHKIFSRDLFTRDS